MLLLTSCRLLYCICFLMQKVQHYLKKIFSMLPYLLGFMKLYSRAAFLPCALYGAALLCDTVCLYARELCNSCLSVGFFLLTSGSN